MFRPPLPSTLRKSAGLKVSGIEGEIENSNWGRDKGPEYHDEDEEGEREDAKPRSVKAEMTLKIAE